jgi:EF-P beta-lysylation protein EpmB
MVLIKTSLCHVRSWQQQLAGSISDPAELLRELELDSGLVQSSKAAANQFSMRVPRGFVARMRKGDPNDPLLRQVLPLAAELIRVPGFTEDPVGDRLAQCAPGVLHKYYGRVLLRITRACAIHCRYCFRRKTNNTKVHIGIKEWQQALNYMMSDTSLYEVILSGGDPLSLSDKRLSALLVELDSIPHIGRLRIHSRQPIVLPERVNDGLLMVLAQSRLQLVLVVHTNHPREIDNDVRTALSRLERIGVRLFNQSVLLRGVNDTAETLAELSESLFSAHVLPYYLHILDRVCGAAHYEVKEDEASGILQLLRRWLPGYLVPRLVREEPGHMSKTLLI